METTRHADVRAQQRCIPPFMIDLLLQFGAREAAGAGTQKVFFDRRTRKQLQSYVGAVAPLLDPHLDIYAVVSPSEAVITVGHRLERIRR